MLSFSKAPSMSIHASQTCEKIQLGEHFLKSEIWSNFYVTGFLEMEKLSLLWLLKSSHTLHSPLWSFSRFEKKKGYDFFTFDRPFLTKWLEKVFFSSPSRTHTPTHTNTHLNSVTTLHFTRKHMNTHTHTKRFTQNDSLAQHQTKPHHTRLLTWTQSHSSILPASTWTQEIHTEWFIHTHTQNQTTLTHSTHTHKLFCRGSHTLNMQTHISTLGEIHALHTHARTKLPGKNLIPFLLKAS